MKTLGQAYNSLTRPVSGSLTSRRQWLQIAAVGLAGLGPIRALRAGVAESLTPVRACILVFYQGGPSHLDTWDMKPKAPAEVRGEFKPIATAVPGLWASEHLPHLARVADRLTIVRSIHHGLTNHLPAAFTTLIGRDPSRGDQLIVGQDNNDPPSIGSSISRTRPAERPGIPPFVALPHRMWNEIDVPGQSAGFLGSAFEPLQVEGDPSQPDFRLPELEFPAGVTSERLKQRANLLAGLERPSRSADPLAETGTRDAYRRKAMEMLGSETVRRAFDLRLEAPITRDLYGRTRHGQSLLLARRLVESGVQFVAVYDRKINGAESWDTHGNNFGLLKNSLLPPADQGLAALVEDLAARGLLDSTLVIALGEFGRSPRVNGGAGRDHWPYCYNAVFSGGGARGGFVYGASDSLGAYPDVNPVTPADIATTLFWRFGLDPGSEIRDRTDRPYRLADGQPIRTLFGVAETS
ncbi:MAG: hypothetical protein JWM11_961 [Planctomycetaceae bacterium]|nr:hypothetical protein [Planctomycetaceae bacterium]